MGLWKGNNGIGFSFSGETAQKAFILDPPARELLTLFIWMRSQPPLGSNNSNKDCQLIGVIIHRWLIYWDWLQSVSAFRVAQKHTIVVVVYTVQTAYLQSHSVRIDWISSHEKLRHISATHLSYILPTEEKQIRDVLEISCIWNSLFTLHCQFSPITEILGISNVSRRE